jgi:hypothetical protein
MHICGGFSLFSCFGGIHSIHLLNLFEKSKLFQNTKPFLYHSLNGCHRLPKRGRLKASRPLISVLVIHDNYCGLTFLFEV